MSSAARNQDDVEVFDFNTGRAGWQKEYDESGIRARWRGPVFIARSPGWFGVRWRRRPYYVLRDSRRHKPLFSEREGIRPFRLLVQVGHWQLGVKP